MLNSDFSRPEPAKIEIRDLTGIRGYSILFAGLNFEMSSGKFASLRGPNGSGKTTLLRMIAGLASIEAGTITYGSSGEDVSTPDLFYLGHEHGLRANETPASHLKDWADIHHASRDRITPALERVGLAKRTMVPAYALSAGQKKRLGLARALIAPRSIWLLDEPAAALDIAGQALLCDLVREHCASGGLCIAALHDPMALEPDAILDLAEFQP